MESLPPEPSGQMSLIDHLDELRKRLIKYLIVLFAILLACYGLRKEILDVIRAPVEVPLQKYAAQAPTENKAKQGPKVNLSALDCSCLPALNNNQLGPAIPMEGPTKDVSPIIPLAEGVEVQGPVTAEEQIEDAWGWAKATYKDFRAVYLSLMGREREAAEEYHGQGQSSEELAESEQGSYVQSEMIYFDCSCRTKAQAKKAHMVYIGLPELFFAQMKAAIYAAIFFSFPFLLIQIWGFVGPALYWGEKTVFWVFSISSYILFTGGSLFGYFVVFPFGFDFFLSLAQPGEIMPSLSVGEYLNFTIKLFLAFGTIFELPLVVFILSRLGVVTPELMLKQGRVAMLGILIVSAVLTPPDPFTMLLMALPLTSLYVISILVSFMAVNRKKAALRAQGLNPEEFD